MTPTTPPPSAPATCPACTAAERARTESGSVVSYQCGTRWDIAYTPLFFSHRCTTGWLWAAANRARVAALEQERDKFREALEHITFSARTCSPNIRGGKGKFIMLRRKDFIEIADAALAAAPQEQKP